MNPSFPFRDSLFCRLNCVLAICLFTPVVCCYGDTDDEKLRIIVIGAHPDDAELEAGGTAALWAAKGHHVKFVSTTNGDIGHAREAGAPLAVRRIEEVRAADKVLGVEATEVYDIHDGELMPTLENRRMVTKSIREWKADIVIAHRPNDYHPDHRYTGILVQDAAFMVIVKSFLPTVPNLTKNPVFLYTEDGFRKPNPMDPDVVVSIDEVIEQKIDALWKLESQIESFWATPRFRVGRTRSTERSRASKKEGPTSRDYETALRQYRKSLSCQTSRTLRRTERKCDTVCRSLRAL